jgi:TatA/E family protein of Tat protein translocase
MIPGAFEVLLVLAIIAVFFGAGKLPAVMQAMGQGVKQFREANHAVNDAANEAKRTLLGDDDAPKR